MSEPIKTPLTVYSLKFTVEGELTTDTVIAINSLFLNTLGAGGNDIGKLISIDLLRPVPVPDPVQIAAPKAPEAAPVPPPPPAATPLLPQPVQAIPAAPQIVVNGSGALNGSLPEPGPERQSNGKSFVYKPEKLDEPVKITAPGEYGQPEHFTFDRALTARQAFLLERLSLQDARRPNALFSDYEHRFGRDGGHAGVAPTLEGLVQKRLARKVGGSNYYLSQVGAAYLQASGLEPSD